MRHITYGQIGDGDTAGGYCCPKCGKDTSNLALIELIVSHEVCESCVWDASPHLIEAKWHRLCYDQTVSKQLL